MPVLKFKYLIILFLGVSLNLSGQLKTYLSVETGPAADISRISDPGSLFENSIAKGSVFGATVWQEIIPGMYVGTGLYHHRYSTGINLTDNRPHQGIIPAFNALMIPARVSYRYQPEFLEVSITPILGYHFGIASESTLPANVRSELATPDGHAFTYQMQRTVMPRSGVHLLEAGMSIDYRFYNYWQISWNIAYFKGLSAIQEDHLVYESTSGNSLLATYAINGSRLQTTVSLHAPISNIWNDRYRRMHQRIEHSNGRGSDIRKKHYIYAGVDMGPVWRSFISTNPAIGAVPLSGKGVFRYSNLYAGMYIGYMLNERTGLDIGVIYQRSKTYASIMYDHESDLAIRLRSPFFLEVPLKFRYFQPLPFEDYTIVPVIGITGITHISGAGYLSGESSFDHNGTNRSMSYSADRITRFGAAILTGIGLEYNLPVKFNLIATAEINYRHGLRIIDRTTVSTTVPETPVNSTIDYAGSGWQFNVGIRKTILLGRENRDCRKTTGGPG